MAINLMPTIKQQYLNNNGFPLAGGKLFSYVAGTSNPADTYSDSNGTLNSNPVILDERGEADVWLSSALSYKFVLKDVDDTVIYTVDNVTGSGGGSSSGNNELVKVSVTDIAAQYLEDKLVAGQDISITKLNTGAVEQLEIASTIDVSKFVTVDTEQLGLTGNKEWNSNHTFNKGLLLNGGWFAGSQGTGEPYLLFDHNAYSYMAKTNAGIKIVTSEPSVNNVSLNVGVNSGIVSFESVSAGSGNFFASNFTSAEGDDRNASQSYAGINAAIQGGNSSYLYAYSGNDLVGSKIEAKADTIDLIGTTYIDTTTGTATKLIAKEADGKLIEVDLIDSSVTLQDAYDNSLTEPEILTDATRGAVTIKNGINNEALKVLEVQNFAGNNTAAFTGAGQLQLDSPNIQPQIVFDSNGGVDLDHYIQYNPGNVGGITLKSQQVGSEVTTLELNRNSSGEFKLSGNSSDTTKSAQLINTYSTLSDEAYLQLISRNHKTATKTATITVGSGSTDLAKDSEISLSAEKINTFSASVIGRDPVASNEFATKNYTDSAIGSAIIGTAVYKGTWNASTNTPDLTSVAKAQGDFYIVSVAGTTSIDGINEWSVGDWVLFNGTVWEKVDNSQTIPVNVGNGAQVFKSLNGVTNVADFRTLIGGSIISLTQNASDITINDSNVVSISGAQTISGEKTFTAPLNIDTAGSFYASTGGYSGVVLDKPLLLNHQSSPALVFNAADGANTAAYMLYSTGGQALTIKNGNSQIDLVENGNYSFGGDGTTKTSLQTSIDGVHGTNYATLKLAARDNTGGYGYAEVEINSGDSTNGAVPSFVNLVGEEVRVNGTPIDFTNYANIAYTDVANIFTQSQTIKSGNATQALTVKNDANANVIELWSDTDGDGYAAFKDSGGTDVVLIDTDSSSGYAMKVTGSQELTGELIMTSPSARIRNDDDTGYLQMTGSKDNVTGANILLYGASNVTDTKGRLRYDTTTKLLWDADSVDVQAFDFSVDTDTLFVDASTDRVGIGTSSPSEALTVNGNVSVSASGTRILGGFGTVSTAGVLDFNDVSNSTAGSGYSLLHSTASNSPLASGINYWYPFTFEHTSKNGTGNRTQMAIPYGNLSLLGNLNYRSYYNTGWTGWREIIATKEDSRDVDFQGVVNLASATNGSPGNGDIWLDSTSGDVTIQGDTSVSGSAKITSTATSGTSLYVSNNANEVGEESLIWVGGENKSNYGVFFGATPEVSTPSVQDHAFIIKTNPSTGLAHIERLRVTSNGDVGIGTSSPSAKLHVNGGISRFQQNGTNTQFYGTDHTYLAFHPKGAGREGYFGYSAASTDRLTIMNENASSLDLGTNSSTRVRIDSAGNVGIGTTSPSAKLDVDGDTTVSGDLVVTGNINVRIGTTTSTASLTVDSDLYDQYNVTALATTMAVQAPTNGSDGKKLIIRITDDGTARGISFPGLTAVGVTFPNTTQGNSAKTIYIGCIYNGQQSRWDAIAVAEEA